LPTSDGSIDDELRVLSILNCLKHPNILELLGSYTLQEKYNFLFPLASQTLTTYLSSSNQTLGFPEHTSVILALPGLASALEALHLYAWEDVSLIGCHHDIKPDNILIMEDRFILADFGLSTFKDTSKGSDTYFRFGQGFYFAPECEDYDDDFIRHRIGRASDIWSLGCVIAELLVFMTGGATAVKKFKQDRRVTFGGYFTTSTFHYGKAPNPAVERCLDEMQTTAPDEATSELIVLTRDMLSLEPEKRPRASQTLKRLRSLALKNICSTIQRDYDDLGNSSLSFDFLLEKERFTCWSEAFRAVLDPVTDSTSSVLESDDVYGSVAKSLSHMRSTLSSVREYIYNIHVSVTKLRQINNDLEKVLDAPAQATVMKELELRILNLDGSDADAFSNTTHPFNDVSAYPRVGILAALRHMHTLSQAPSNSTEVDWRIDRHCLYEMNPNRSNAFEVARFVGGDSEPRDVLIQWMVYDAKWAGELGKILFARVAAIVSFLRAASEVQSFRILNCHGYFHETQRHAFGVIFSHPNSDTGNRLNPTTLHQLIQNTQNVRNRPELGQLFRLAHSLTTSLLEYHTISWLHKNISSHHIVFFSTRKDLSTYNISTPYVIGFDHSRPDRPNEYSEGPWDEQNRMKYHHPLYRGGKDRFRPEFDYFSLGLVLLEIGLWKSLEDVPNALLTPQDEHQSYLKRMQGEVLPLLGPRMGRVYRDATLACLAFNVNLNTTQSTGSERQILSHFRESVVDTLASLSV
jgi:serine/threonine protein kinase